MALARPPTAATAPGLHHAEVMMQMELGSPLLSPRRAQLRHLAMFASWKDEDAIDAYLRSHGLGGVLDRGWHVRLEFLRRWGHVTEFDGLPSSAAEPDPEAPTVAVTLARMKLPQLPRFIRWGKPVEALVRDHPGTTLALAAAHPLRTVSTFSVWETQQDMTNMVRGHGAIADPDRHAAAMVERSRKDFHFEFTTLRFRATSERGQWKGRSGIVPT